MHYIHTFVYRYKASWFSAYQLLLHKHHKIFHPHNSMMLCLLDADVSTLQEKAAKALRSLKSFKEDISCEQQRNFGSYEYSCKGKRPQFHGGAPATKRVKSTKTSWTHQFVCLADHCKMKPPAAAWER